MNNVDNTEMKMYISNSLIHMKKQMHINHHIDIPNSKHTFMHTTLTVVQEVYNQGAL